MLRPSLPTKIASMLLFSNRHKSAVWDPFYKTSTRGKT
jgi:hypothetical protein